jgi:hypothetical protein
MDRHLRLAGLFLVSVALIGYEIYVVRVFSVGSWSNLGTLVIGTALLGFGVSGTVLTFLEGRIRRNPRPWLLGSTLLFSATMAGASFAAQLVPFSPLFLGSDPVQLLWIAIYYLLYSLPFFFAATFIGASFIAADVSVSAVYFWNMLGSGVGGIAVLLAMLALPPASLIIPIEAMSFTAAILCGAFVHPVTRRSEISVRHLTASSAVFLAASAASILWGDIRVSEYKPVSYVRKYPDAQEVHHSYSPAGEMRVFSSSFLHFAPGLSDKAGIDLKTMPQQPFLGLYVDGSGPIGVMGRLREEEAAYMDYLPMAAPYIMLNRPRVLLVNLGGGISAQLAAHNAASSVTVVERNPDLVKLMRDDPRISLFTGDLLRRREFDVSTGDARVTCDQHPGSFDLVEVGLIDSVGLTDTGGYPLEENFTYTVEALQSYIRGLSPKGMLSITVWDRLNPPRNVLRLLTTVVDTLREQNAASASQRLFVFGLYMSTATVLVKNSDFTDAEIYDLRQFALRRGFDIIYDGGIERRKGDLASVLAYYRAGLARNPAPGEGVQYEPSDLYHHAIRALLRGDEQQLVDSYVFDVRPMRDERPYYSGYLKLSEIGLYFKQIRALSEEWGHLLQLVMLGQSVVLGILVILIPLLFRSAGTRGHGGSAVGLIVYYALLGLGYMLVEIFLIQRLGRFLSNPTYAVTIVISSMLVISGLGNVASGLLARHRAWAIRIACVGIIGSMAFYFLGLDSLLGRFAGRELLTRISIAVAAIAPAAFFLGVPFPGGLSLLAKNRPGLLPWAWGMNGGFSVMGVALARIVSVAWGFPVVLMLVGAVYVGVGLLAGANGPGRRARVAAPE